MQSETPSKTALAAALYRAAHQVFEQGKIFSDPLALKIVGVDAEQLAGNSETQIAGRKMRLFIAARTRFAEDALAKAIESGVKQLVILGAGLDTYAYRNATQSDATDGALQVFEVDHPATQAWKRQRLAEAQIEIPKSLTFAPTDFERQTLREGLSTAGFDFSLPTFFTWLGVVPYLSEPAVWSTLEFIAQLGGGPGGAQVVFDYADPPDSLSAESRLAHEQRAQRVAAIGEAWVSYFSAETLHPKLKAIGFAHLEDLSPRQIAIRYFPLAAALAPNRGGHIIHAST